MSSVCSGHLRMLPKYRKLSPILEVPQMMSSGSLLSLLVLLLYSANLGGALPLDTIRDNDSDVYTNAAVAADAGVCSEIGANILKQGGSAVDTAIASLICVGVVNLHSTGIGGGGFMLFYEASTGKSYSLDYRETAPLAASYDMYDGRDPSASREGGLSMAVPGELRGLEMAWKRWGKLEWKDLFQSSIDLARNGFPVSATISTAIQSAKASVSSGKFPGLLELLAPNGEFLMEGDILRRPLYANTLEMVASEGADYIYNSNFTTEMVEELREQYGSIISEEDFFQYRALERTVTTATYEDLNVLGVSPPCSGAVLGLILNILDHYDFNAEDFGNLSYHRIVEAFKFAYAQRLKLGDPAFNVSVDPATTFMLDPDVARELFNRITDSQTHEQEYYMFPSVQFGDTAHDHGTSHLSVLAENGDAVACTSTINLYFGSLMRSQKNGVIYNDEMDDFSYPSRNESNSYKQTKVNYIEPGKRPLSSTSPTIITDKDGNVKMVVGASGGFRITTSVAQVILDVLGFEKSLEESISLRRLHHQLYPNHITVERVFPPEIVQDLQKRGHEVVVSSAGAVVQGIFVNDNKIYATCDARKGGQPSGY